MSKKIERINGEIKKEISRILINDIKDPRLTGMVSVLRVKATNDLSYATVNISILGDEESKKQSLDAVKSSAGYIRRELGKRLRIRHVPELRFEFDDYIEKGFKINEIINSLKEGRQDEH